VSTFGSGTTKLVFGRGLSLAIGFATAPVIARLFSPAEFGIAGIIGSAGAWVGAFACMGYAQAIPLAKTRSETRALIKICLLCTLCLLLPVMVIPAIGGGLLSALMAAPALAPLMWFVPLMFLTISAGKIAHYTCSKEGRFGLLAISAAAQANLGRAMIIISGLFLGGGAFWLLLANLLGSALGATIAAGLVIAILVRNRSEQHLPGPTTLSVAKQHKQFPRVQVWNSVLNVASLSAPILVMGSCFDASVVGFYSFGQKLLMLPIALLGSSVARVFYPEAATEWNETGSVSETVRKSVRVLSVSCVFPMIAVGMLGPLLYTRVFGSAWHEAGVYAQILAPWMLIILVASPISTVFLIRQRARTLLIYNIVLLIGRIGALVVGARLGGPRTAIACFAAIGVVVFLHLMVIALRLGKAGFRSAEPVLHEALRALALILPAAVFHWMGAPAFVSLGTLGVATLLHSILVYRREPAVQRRVGRLASWLGLRNASHAAKA